MGLGSWLHVLARHGFRISPTRYPMACMLTGLSSFNSVLAALQNLCYHRRIADTSLVSHPIFVVGHWRAGTTLLHELLVLDDQFTFPNTFACFAPNHFLISEWWLKRLIGFFLPRQRPMDNMAIGWDLPQEDEWALCNMGLPSPYFKIMFPNLPMQDEQYSSLRTLAPGEKSHWQRSFHWFLKSLTVRSAKPIVLKTPVHTSRIAALTELFPQAKFIHITRDPALVIPSTLHTWQRMYRYHGLQVPRFEHLQQEVLATFAEMFTLLEQDWQALSPQQAYTTSYEQLTDDPLQELERIYHHFQLPISPQVRQRWQAYVDRTANYKTNRYVLPAEQRDAIERSCGDYARKYGYATTGK